MRRHALVGSGWPYALIALFVLLVLYPFVFGGKCLYWGDLSLYFYPLYDVMAHALRSGRLPLWNPYVNCGQPLLGNPQSSVFYPSTLVYLLWSPWRAYTVVVAAHLILAGWGTYLYLLRLTNDRAASALAGALFAGSGYVVARLQFPTMVQAMAYLPWILWLIDRVIAEPRVLNGVFLCLALACLLAAGHAQVAYMTLACALVYGGVRIWQMRVSGRRTRAAVTTLGWAGMLALVLNSVQLLPTLQLFRMSTRTHLTWAETNRFVLLPEQLLNFLVPRFFGDPSRGDYWGAGNAWEPCVYVGIPALCLAVLALAASRGRMAVRFYGWLALISLLLALGRYGGIFWAAYYLVPGISSFHDPARFAFLTTFALCILAGLGMKLLKDLGVPAAGRAGIFVVACVQPAVLSGTFNPGATPEAVEARPAFVALPDARAHRVYSAQHQEVWQRYVNYADYGPAGATTLKWFADTLEPNLGMRFGIAEASGYEPVPVRWVAEVDSLVRSALMRHRRNLPELLSLFDARWLVLPQGTRYRHPGLAPLRVPGAAVYQVQGSGTGAWTVRRTVRVDGSDRSLAAISEPGFDPHTVAVVSGSGGLDERPASLGEPLPPPAAVRVLKISASSFTAEVAAGPFPAFLVRSAAAYPGWHVWVDRAPARVEVADHAFQGVVVPPGNHRVTFRYEPGTFRVGLYLTLVAFGALACLAAQGLREHRLAIKEIGSGQSNNKGSVQWQASEEG
ncbi:MAG: YfhO family protein [Chthonomonadales bacterium]